jgi:hypothetical protein
MTMSIIAHNLHLSSVPSNVESHVDQQLQTVQKQHNLTIRDWPLRESGSQKLVVVIIALTQDLFHRNVTFFHQQLFGLDLNIFLVLIIFFWDVQL